MAKKAMSAAEKEAAKKERELKKAKFEADYKEFSELPISSIVSEQVLKEFYKKTSELDDIDELRVLSLMIEAFNADKFQLKTEVRYTF